MSPVLTAVSGAMLPASEDAERAILGSILLDCERFHGTAALEPSAFSLDSHQRIFRTMRKIAERGNKIDLITLSEALGGSAELQAIGGVAYLASLTEGLPRYQHIDEYTSLVYSAWQKRQFITLCIRYANQAGTPSEESPAELVAAFDRELLEVVANSGRDWPSIEHQTHEALERMDSQIRGDVVLAYEYGIPSLDRLIGGLTPREMTVLGGRPAQGKSSLIAQLAARHCPKQIPMHVFSLEMTAEQFLRRLWSIVSGIPFSKIRHPQRLTPEENRSVRQAALEVGGWPLVIDDAAYLTADQIVARARISKRRAGTKIVAIDYLQKMRFNDKPQMRYHEVTAATVAMAALAKEEDLALLLLSSVSEKAGRDRNDPPTLQDFRQSGDIAYEASTALLIHREIDEQTEKPLQDGLIIVAKARSDETGAVGVWFDTQALVFGERAGVRR